MIVEESNTPLGRIFDLSIQLLIVLSLVSFSIETVPDISESTRLTLRIFEIVSVAIFTIEYLLRVLVADRPLKYIASFFGVIDAVAILPFFLSLGFDLRFLRVFRMFRLVRILKLARYGEASRRFYRAFMIAREELMLFLGLTAIMLFVSAAGIYIFEHSAQPETFSSIFSSLWWAVVTLTTVGYGDVYPVTAGGRIFTTMILMIGLGIVAVPTAIMASALSQARIELRGAVDAQHKNGNNKP